MKNIIKRFKKIIRFSVTIFASREFAFIYCIFGTLAQLAHTYFLTENISSLSGNWKSVQATIVAFFISSSLLFFVAIADNEKTKESRRINFAVNLFMFVEIIINIYYYSRHLLIDVQDIKIFDFIFGLLVSCLIPITIKLYASTIRAKEWMEEIEGKNISDDLNKAWDENNKHINTIHEIIDIRLNDFKSQLESTNDDIAWDELIDKKIQELKDTIMKNIDTDVAKIFDKNQMLFLTQFENKCKLMMNQITKNVEA